MQKLMEAGADIRQHDNDGLTAVGFEKRRCGRIREKKREESVMIIVAPSLIAAALGGVQWTN